MKIIEKAENIDNLADELEAVTGALGDKIDDLMSLPYDTRNDLMTFVSINFRLLQTLKSEAAGIIHAGHELKTEAVK